MAKAKLTPEGWKCDKEGNHIYRPKWVDFQGSCYSSAHSRYYR